jgi:hypothetical protein
MTLFDQTKTVCMKQWQAVALLGLSGFAVGTLLARLANALGL